LDVGCASGYLAAALSERGSATVGIEPDPAMAAQAEEHCERVFAMPLEEAMAELDGERFDAVVFGDVLEHLVDPWSTLAWARQRPLAPEPQAPEPVRAPVRADAAALATQVTSPRGAPGGGPRQGRDRRARCRARRRLRPDGCARRAARAAAR